LARTFSNSARIGASRSASVPTSAPSSITCPGAVERSRRVPGRVFGGSNRGALPLVRHDRGRVREKRGCTLIDGMTIDPYSYPLFFDIAQGAQWVGTDEFPSSLTWADEHEAWLRFAKETGCFDHYVRRLRGPKETRDETFAELAVAYFLVKLCGT